MSRLVSERRYAVLLTLGVAAYALVVLRLQTHWWFEDDPYQIAQAMPFKPWDFFVSRDALSKGIIGLQFTPLQNVTYWIDAHLWPRSPGGAYFHTTLALWLAMWLWMTVLARWLGARGAFAVVVLALLLPSTIVIVEFVSLRNYLNGLWLSAAGVLCAQRALVFRGARYWLAAVGAAGFALLGSLSKEIFVTTPFALILVLFLSRRRWGGAAAISAAGMVYLAYHSWLMGSLSAPFSVIPTLSLAEYPRFVARYPFIFAGSPAGWALFAAGAGAIGLGVLKKWVRPMDLALVAVLASITLATLHPAAGELDRTYLTRGTWYRAAFLMGLVVLAGAAWLIRAFPRPWRLGLGACALVTLALGAALTVHTWDDLHAQYDREGRFYLANPDKLLYSEVPAWWFLVGVDRLYRVPDRHYVLASRPGQPGDVALLNKFDTVWRYSPVIGAHFPSPATHRELAASR
jgi:hypothetical protein